MRKMKRLITLLMTVVMMMAMSITAFANQTVTTVNGPDVTITRISNREGVDEKGKDIATLVKIYKLATVDSTSNKVIVEDWAKSALLSTDGTKVKDGLVDEFPVGDLDKAFEQANPQPTTFKDDQTSVNGADVTFTGLPAGAYYIKVIGHKVQYNSMVAVTYKVSEEGNYEAKTAAVELKAKGAKNTLDKVADDRFVQAGDIVPFRIKSTVPYNVENYSVIDKQKNLNAPYEIKVTVGNKTFTNKQFEKGSTDSNGFTTYTMNLDEFVNEKVDGKLTNAYAGQTVVIEYKAVVTGDNGYENQAYDSTYGDDDTPAIVKGYTGSIVLYKKDANTQTLIRNYNAGFKVFEGNSQTPISFVKKNDGEYRLAESTDDATATTDTVYTKNGTVRVDGLHEATYNFNEVEAPKGYSINTQVLSVVISELDQNKVHVEQNVVVDDENLTSFFDSTLIQLPFTGGMGTTIFTILGVAIMAMAAALFFATKKSHN